MEDTSTIGPFTVRQIKKQFDRHKKRGWRWDNDIPDNYFVLKYQGKKTQYAVKIGNFFATEEFVCELAWMKTMETCISPEALYVFPKGYGIVKHDIYVLLVVEHLAGRLFWEVMNCGEDALSAADAREICAAIRDLRQNTKLPESVSKNGLTPVMKWAPRSAMFPFGDAGGRVIDNGADFKDFMGVRFNRAGVNEDLVSLDRNVWTYGALVPLKIKRLTDGRLGFIDLKSAFVAPWWWEPFLASVPEIGPVWDEPLQEAFKESGLVVDKSLEDELWKFRVWFGNYGWAFGE